MRFPKWLGYAIPVFLMGTSPFPAFAGEAETGTGTRTRTHGGVEAPRPGVDIVPFPWGAHPQTSGGRPLSIAAMDFDGDGTEDLAVGIAFRGGYRIVMYPGRPAGPLSRATNLDGSDDPVSKFFDAPVLIATPVAPRGIHGGDFDADGYADLLVASPGGDELFLLRGDGRGGFGDARAKELPGVLRTLTVGDLDRDGLPDWKFEAVCAGRVQTFWAVSPRGAWVEVPQSMDLGPDGEARAENSPSADIPGLPDGFDGVVRLRLNADAFDDTVAFREEPPALSMFLTRPESVYTVTSAADAGAGTLRQAISDANASPGPDAVIFAIGSGPQTIAPLTPLPVITDPVTLDATTQPGYSGTPLIQLSGASAGLGAVGLDLAGGSSVVRGFALNRFEHGILSISGPGGNIVEGNFIGTDLSGASGFANPWTPPDGLSVGVSIADSPDNRIGGTSASARNVIASNWDAGISITGATSTGNLVLGNYIGTTSSGTVALGNGARGVDLRDGASNTVGGTAPGAGNVISGNGTVPPGADGLQIRGATGTLVQGNLIGVDSTGQSPLPNAGSGIRIRDASSNRIGGSTAASRNVVSGNLLDGIEIRGASAANQIQGNFVGVGADGLTARANGAAGILLTSGSNNTLGGVSGAGNRIAFNAGAGIFGVAGTGNAFMENSIASNGGLGIDLGTGGITANDAGDTDAGANNLQNFPVLTASSCGATTTVQGTLNSLASTPFTLEFFASPTCDGAGNGEGATFLGSSSTTTNASGNASFSVSLSGTAPPGHFITATATTSGNTSEFSACRSVAGVLPAEVGDLRWALGSSSGMRWAAQGGTLSYALYRGDGSTLPHLADAQTDSCLRWTGATASTGEVLTETPAAGSFYWYLVAGSTTCGEGPAHSGLSPDIAGPCG